MRYFAHRWSYEYFKGPMPTDLVTDHLCRNPICVNPIHLEAVSNLINIGRGDGVCAVYIRKRLGDAIWQPYFGGDKLLS
jgi:HNH endonuclease